MALDAHVRASVLQSYTLVPVSKMWTKEQFILLVTIVTDFLVAGYQCTEATQDTQIVDRINLLSCLNKGDDA